MPTNFGLKVKVELARRNMNMTELAKLLEISRPYLSDIIYGRRIAAEQKERIKKVLDIKEED
ncbi:helix-turn-helix domain-containing protein [Jeotgalibaca porci]|uniref:helix-turn-helix domain-containing protein n=1 Tax=Jeotgalibaca porci TaxID=1868793 RepID=UPI00359F296B